MPEGPRTILVVDDTPENISVMTAALAGRWKVRAATTGEKALKLCAADPVPDLVLLDVVMPGMDGIEVCRRLKADPRTAAIPVIFVTGTGDASIEEQARALGAAGMIAKPVDPAVARGRIAACLGEAP